MGFAAGLKQGSGLVQSVLDNERQAVLDARAAEEYDYKKGERERVNQAWGGVGKFGREGPASSTAIPEDYLTPEERAVPKPAGGLAPPAPAGGIAPPAAGLAPPAAGLAPPAAPAGGLAPPAAPAAGLAPPAAPAPAAAPAAPATSEAMQHAREMFNVAVASRDANAVTQARTNIEAVDQREILGKVGKMTPKEISTYVQQHANLTDGLKMSIAEAGPGKYRLTTWGKDGIGKETLLNGAQAQQLAASHMLMEKYPDKGMAMAAGVHKDLDAMVKEHNAEMLAQNTQANTAVHNFDTQQETGRHNRAAEGNAAANTAISRERLGLERDKATDAKKDSKLASMDIVASNKDGYVLMNKRGEREFVQYPEGVTQQDFVKKYMPQGDTAPKINADGSATFRGDLYEKDPKTNKWTKAEGFGPSAIETKFDTLISGKNKPGAAKPDAAKTALEAGPPRTAMNPPPNARQELAERAQKEVQAKTDPELAALMQQYNQASGRQAVTIGQQIRQMRMERYGLESSPLGL
jgi:hypothetical protein